VRSCEHIQEENEELKEVNKRLLSQQHQIRAAAAAELETAMRLVETALPNGGPPSQTAPRVDTETGEVDSHPAKEEGPPDSPQGDTREPSPRVEEQGTPSVPLSKLQAALSLDQELSLAAEEPPQIEIAKKESRDLALASGPPSPHRVSTSVFPTKKEVITLTPVPIVMNAQFLESPFARKQRPQPVETAHSVTPISFQPSPMTLPSPSAYLQHYDDRPATPELEPLIVSPPGMVQSRRGSDPLRYLTASQALERQQRLSLRMHTAAAAAPAAETPQPVPPSRTIEHLIDQSPVPRPLPATKYLCEESETIPVSDGAISVFLIVSSPPAPSLLRPKPTRAPCAC
jgi:hypothetical protein